jgi:predicted PurR-regulated permease PerM
MVPATIEASARFDPPPERPDTASVAVSHQIRRRPGGGAIVSVMLIGILTLMVFYTLYFARDVFMPILLAMLLKLLLNPGVRLMAKGHIPQALGALVMITLLVGVVSGIAYTVAAPASGWLAKAPQQVPILQQRLHFLTGPLAQLERASQQVEQAADMQHQQSAVVLKGPSLTEFLFSGTRSVLTAFATMLILLYFLLAAGDVFLRRLVEVLPSLSDKKQAVEMTRQVEKDISTYLVTITLINAGLGACTGAMLWAIGMPDALLWGVLVFVLNFMPYLGPLIGISILLIIGMISFQPLGQALLPVGIYLVLVIAEGQFITPITLARRLTLNPVALFISLMIWGWMWGVPGAFLAVPLLATFKIICDYIRPLAPVGHFLGE